MLHIEHIPKQLKMRVSTICTYMTKRSLKVLVSAGVAFAVILALTGGWFVHTEVRQHNETIRKAAETRHEQLVAANLTKQHSLQSETNTAKSGDVQNSKPSNPNNSVAPAPTPKYATSSDPRSTAYSTTPPAPTPETINISVTHNGQVGPGTLISFNPTKHEKTYYGGDLVFDNPSITVSKSAGGFAAFSVATPDGATANMPAMPWNDNSKIVYSSANVGAAGAGTSWPLHANLYSASTSNGSYTLHLQTFRTAQTTDAWEYDGFLIVNVTD